MKKDNKAFSFESPDESPGYLLWQVTMLWQRKAKNGLDGIGITHTQFVLMAALKWLTLSKKEVFQIEVAKHAKVDRMMTSKIFKNLKSKGLIAFKDSTTDSRAKALRLTEKGNSIFNLAIEIVEQVDSEFFSKLDDQVSIYKDLMHQLMKSD